MTVLQHSPLSLRHPDRFFIGGEWVTPSSSSMFDVIDSSTEQVCLRVAEAQAADIDRAVGAAREAFDHGPWPRLSHAERAEYLRAFARVWRSRAGEVADIYPRETGILHSLAGPFADRAANEYEMYAGFADTYPFEEVATPTLPGFGLLVREPVGVVGAIIPWNGPVTAIAHKVGPALITGCTIVLKSAPEAPAEGLMAAEIAEEIGLPPGVLNVVTADREVSELLVRDARVDKISFTGSTAAGRQIGRICADRVARVTLELGGKSAAVVLEDADIERTAGILSAAECSISGQVCSSLTRIVVQRSRQAELVEALKAGFGSVHVGDPFDPESQMGPLAADRQRTRVEGYIAQAVQEGARLVAGGGRPAHLDRGYYVEPTVFADVDSSHTISREEIFGPVLSVIPAADEADAIRIANDSAFGLNASVFTEDVDRARAIAGQLRSGTVGHNSFRTDFAIGFGGFKQSGIGREGGREVIQYYTEAKTVILDGPPRAYRQ